MGSPELSLGPSAAAGGAGAKRKDGFRTALAAANHCKKRKLFGDHLEIDRLIQTSVELQLRDPLPSDWEQCLDLQSGRMYYVNRNTSKKSWKDPEDRKLDLDLNISTVTNFKCEPEAIEDQEEAENNSCTSMVAVACLRCHLLVMLRKSYPSCPNCKYLHSFPEQEDQGPNAKSSKSALLTLSLLN